MATEPTGTASGRDVELLRAARDIAKLEQKRRKAAQALEAIDSELKTARRTLRALAQSIAGVDADVETPMPEAPK